MSTYSYVRICCWIMPFLGLYYISFIQYRTYEYILVWSQRFVWIKLFQIKPSPPYSFLPFFFPSFFLSFFLSRFLSWSHLQRSRLLTLKRVWLSKWCCLRTSLRNVLMKSYVVHASTTSYSLEQYIGLVNTPNYGTSMVLPLLTELVDNNLSWDKLALYRT